MTRNVIIGNAIFDLKDSAVVINNTVYNIVKSSDVIDSPSKKGTKYWQGHVVNGHVSDFFTCTSSWQTTKDGLSKKMWSEPFYATPTNVGRANERKNKEQAFFEFDSMVQKQMDKRKSEKPLPMLAQKFSERKKHLSYPCSVQPKFDGMRVLYDGDDAWSRGNKPIIPEVFAHLHFNTKGVIVDGELLLPENVKVNDSMSAAKKFHPGISDTLVYRVYDIVDESMTFVRRFNLLQDIVTACKNPNIILARTETAHTEADILRLHAEFTAEGFEGSIIRNNDGKYTINKRSNDLLKHKDWLDEEFLIINIIPSGGGIAETVGKFVCVDEKGHEFESTAMGSFEQRQEYLTNKHLYIGKYAKVKYRERSGKHNVPFHSNTLEVRDREDF